MTSLRLLLLAGMAVAGCTTPRQTYVSQHPGMPPAHRQIMTSGKIPEGNTVAGLTRDEIRLVMGGPPAVFDRVDGQETWAYLKKSSASVDSTPTDADASGRSRSSDLQVKVADPDLNVMMRTTIFFQGDRATRAEITQEKP